MSDILIYTFTAVFVVKLDSDIWFTGLFIPEVKTFLLNFVRTKLEASDKNEEDSIMILLIG